MSSQIPLLTNIIEAGDAAKAGLHHELKEPLAEVSLKSDENRLEQQINHAIDAALPEIKRQLQRELLATLSKH